MNPFESMHSAGKTEQATKLATMFRCAHNVDEVHAMARYDRVARGCVDNGVSGYLSGSHFHELNEKHTGSTWLDTAEPNDLWFLEIRDCAQAFLAEGRI